MTSPCLANTATVELDADGAGVLSAKMLGLGFNHVDAGPSRLTIDLPGADPGTVTAPVTSGVIVGPEGSAEQIHNDRAYPIAILGFMEGSVENVSVPNGEIWNLVLQDNINSGGWPAGGGGAANQIFDNTLGTGFVAFSAGPMIRPLSAVLAPGASISVELRLFLVRSGSGGGTVTLAATQFVHWIAVPCF